MRRLKAARAGYASPSVALMLIVPIGMPLRKGKSKTSLISFARRLRQRRLGALDLQRASRRCRRSSRRTDRGRGSGSRTGRPSRTASPCSLPIWTVNFVNLRTRPPAVLWRTTSPPRCSIVPFGALVDVAAGDREDDPLDGVARRARRAHRHAHVGEALERVDVGLQHRLAAGHRVGHRRPPPGSARAVAAIATTPRPLIAIHHALSILLESLRRRTCRPPAAARRRPRAGRPRRRSQTMSVCTALSLMPPDSG